MKTLFYAIVLLLVSVMSVSAQVFPVYTSATGSSGDVFVSTGSTGIPVFTTIKQVNGITADSSTTSTTAVKSGLSFTAEASATYNVDVYITDSVSTSTGLKFDIYAVSPISYISGSALGTKKSDTCGFDILNADSTLGAAYTTYVPTTNYGVWNAHFTFVNGSTAQTVYIRYAKATSGTAILKRGSYLEAWKR